jgi:8-oxo-dGTP pyrophosphatase MutT (NUDIX family)
MDKPLLQGVLPWTHSADELVAETRIFSLRRRNGQSPTSPEKQGEFVYLESPDWVNVVAITGDEAVLLIEQFRHGTAEVTLEIPGGMVDPGEDALAAGVRELLEETGFGGGSARLIGSVSPNPAILDNRCYTVLAEGVERISDQALEANEEIVVRLHPLAEVPDLVRRGVIHHALVVAAFHHLALQAPS